MEMNAHQAATALIMAVLSFRQKYEADLEVQKTDRALMPDQQKADSEDSIIPEEMDEQNWWEYFTDYVATEGLAKFLKGAHHDVTMIASLEKGEPSFTLMGRDVLSSLLVRHWTELASLSDGVRASKITQAEGTAERMEEYQPQKWPD